VNGGVDMANLLIKGGKPLRGKVLISGAKNSTLPVLAAALLTDEEIVLNNVPDLEDVRNMLQILLETGLKSEFKKNSVKIFKHSKPENNISLDLAGKMRASFNILGPLTVRNKISAAPLPGGCFIGPRPVDIHLEGLEALGIESKLEHGIVHTKRVNTNSKAEYYLKFPSVGATEQLICTAVLLAGTRTVLNNCAIEPEVVQLVEFLISMGAKIQGNGTTSLSIDGVGRLNGTEIDIIPDRMESGTFMAAAVITRGKIEIEGFRENENRCLIAKLREIGAKISISGNTAEISGEGALKGSEITARVYPGLPTDMQPQMTAVACISEGISVITDKVFTGRFSHVGELQRMDAHIHLENNSIIVNGKENLSGAPVLATNLRCAAALTLAGLNAEGETLVQEIEHIFRGYENFDGKLESLGAKVKIV